MRTTVEDAETRDSAVSTVIRSVREAIRRGAAPVKQEKFAVFLMGVTFCSGVFWAGLIPLWQIPDEPAHYGYVQDLGEEVSLFSDALLPRQLRTVQGLTGLGAVPFHRGATQEFAANSQEGPEEEDIKALLRSGRTERDTSQINPAASYPPAYYLLASFIYRLLASSNILTIMFGLRVFSALITSVTVLFHYLTLRRFFNDEATSRATALLIALSPMYIYMGMAVNPDVLVWLAFSVYLYLMTRAVTEGLSTRLNLGLAVTAAVGLWIKQTFLLAVPFYGILLVFLVLQKKLTPVRAVAPLAVFLGAIAVLDGWLYLGDFIRTSPSYPGERQTEEVTAIGFLRQVRSSWTEYRWTFDTFWGNFGWLDTPLSDRVYNLVRWGSAAAAVTLGLHLLFSLVRRRPDTVSFFYLSLAITFIAFFMVINYMRIATGEGWLLQGRYFFPIIVLIIGLQVRGLTSFIPPGSVRNGVLLALVVGMVLFQVDVLVRYVLPRYYL